MEQSPKGSSKLFTDVLCLCAIHESRVRALGPTVLETEPCDGYVIHMRT